jgi:hypothetical protein
MDRSIKVLDKAMEYKRRINLEEFNKKMKSIMLSNSFLKKSNPFHVLLVDDLDSMVSNICVDISTINDVSVDPGNNR